MNICTKHLNCTHKNLMIFPHGRYHCLISSLTTSNYSLMFWKQNNRQQHKVIITKENVYNFNGSRPMGSCWHFLASTFFDCNVFVFRKRKRQKMETWVVSGRITWNLVIIVWTGAFIRHNGDLRWYRSAANYICWDCACGKSIRPPQLSLACCLGWCRDREGTQSFHRSD